MEEAESFGCSMKESLSSSAPRSGEVEEDELEEMLERRCSLRDRAMPDIVVLRVMGVGRSWASCLELVYAMRCAQACE